MDNYIFHLSQLYGKHRILSRATALENDLRKIYNLEELQKLQHKFSALDMERVRYMKKAEHKCKNRKNNTYEWSPALARMGGRVTYWKQRRANAKEKK